MHEIFSKLKSPNVLSGKVKNKPFSVRFAPQETTKVDKKEYEALVNDKGSMFKTLLESGDFVEKAQMKEAEVKEAEAELNKAQAKVKKAKKAKKEAE